MNNVVRRVKLSLVGAALAATLVSLGGVVIVGTALAASQTMVATSSVNLRSGPGTTFGIVEVVSAGASVTATGPAVAGPSSIGSTWTPVTYNGEHGYVATVYLKASAPTVSQTATTTGSANATTNTDVNVRSGPGSSYAIVDHLQAGVGVHTTGVTSGSWSQVVYQGVDRWMYSAYLTPAGAGSGSSSPTPTTSGQVRTTADLYLRADGYFGATILGTLPANSLVDVTGQTTAAYTQILYQGSTAWIASTYTEAATAAPVVLSSTQTTSGSGTLSARQQAVVGYARSKLGDAYVWGAAGPASFDCSGLALAAYQTVGISLPHHAADQATLGTPVARANLQPGDLIFWYSPVQHVSIYVGNGQMIHARGTAYGVVQGSVDEYAQWAYFAGARRFLNS